jgi:copper oxidase (laccase) domain-containing protein
MNIYDSIKFKERIVGYFPEFDDLLKHGFSWGKEAGNMSFNFGSIPKVKTNIQRFLSKLDLGSINNSYVIAPEHSDKIVEIDKRYKPSELGITISCDVLVTKMKNTTLTLKPGDCTSVILYSKNSLGNPVIALVHHGRRGVELKLPKKIVKFLNEKHEVKKEDIRIGVVPHLFTENRKFENIDGLDKEIWEGYIKKENEFFYPMETELAISMYKEAGILDKNISLYKVDTYEAAKEGKSYSYKYSLEMKKKGIETDEGRFIVGMSL